MMAVILAGGKGTRLKPFTMTLPKPLLPLGDVPILEIVIRQLAAAGFRRITLALGHLPHLFTAVIGDGSRLGVDLEYHVENEPLGTAGSLRRIRNPEEHLLVINGDILTTLDPERLFSAHLAAGAAATIAVTSRQVRIDYGVVVPDARGFLKEYVEKPVIPYEVSMGVNVLARSSLDLIPPEGRFDLPDLMTALHRAGRPVSCYRFDGYWQDIGRFDDYQRASEDFANDERRFLPAAGGG